MLYSKLAKQLLLFNMDLFPASTPSDLQLTLMKAERHTVLFVSVYLLSVRVHAHECMYVFLHPLPPLSLAPPCYFSAIEIKVMTGQGKRMFFQ